MSREETRKNKRRGGVSRIVPAIIIVILLAALICAAVAGCDERAGAGFPFLGAREMTDEEIAAKGWISADVLKRYAEEYNVNTEFLSRIFRDKIIYKHDGSIIYEDVDPNLKKNFQDWTLLRREGTRPVYEGSTETGEQVRALFGVDVSRYQGDIDWAKAAADGVEFAMIRAGYRGYDTGRLVEDEFFDANMSGASDAGIKVGVYLFSQAVTEAEALEEAETVIDAVAPYDVTFPVVFDMEEIAGRTARTDGLTTEEVTDLAIAFCERIAQAGYEPMIYANPKQFVSRMDLSRLEPYDKWLAQYYKTPSYPYAFSIWQFTNTGSVDGINGDVDLNLAFMEE